MKQIQRKNPFWSLAGPLLAYFGIQLAVQTVVQAVIQAPYLAQAYIDNFVNGGASDFQEAMNGYLSAAGPAIEQVLKYQVEIAGAAALCTIPLTAVLFAKDRKLEKACGIVPAEKTPFGRYWAVVLFGAVLSVGVTCLSSMAQAVMYDEQYQQTAESMYSASFPVQLLVMGVVIPAAEELMFRGVMYKRYREKRKFWYAALWSSLFFAVTHTNNIQMAYAFFLGICLCWLYERFGSFKAPLVLHISANAASLILTESGAFGWLGAEPIRMAVAAVLCAFVCSSMFVLMQRMTEKEKADATDEKSDSMNMF